LFSKQATDKLREVFETVFRTRQKVERKDALPTMPPVEIRPPADRNKGVSAGTTG
jgi:hypothetical protein